MKPWYDRLHERFVITSIKKRNTIEDIHKWRNYIATFPEPKNAIQASYARYKCRMYHFSRIKKFIMNAFGFVALFVELFYIFTAKEHEHELIKGRAVIERARDIPDYSDIVPEEILNEFKRLEVIDNFNKKFAPLCKTARRWLLQCVRAHPFDFFYIYFVYMELATHSHILLNYNPESVFVYINERNSASPILTKMYEDEGRSFCSFMHGEYALQLIMAFMSFSKYYVWDKSYIEMFKEDLRCNIGEYIVYTPKKLQKKWHLEDTIPTYFCTYYFSGESKESVIKVAEALIRLNNHGKRCSVRLHPRYLLHKKLLEDTIAETDISIENAYELSIKDSLARTKYVVSLKSTVLSEAHVEGREIVLDDISDKEHFDILSMQKFNVFNKPHLLFSELIRQVEG